MQRSFGKAALAVFVTVTFIFMVIPTILAVPMSFTETRFLVFPPQGFTLKWYHKFFTDPQWIGSTLLSLKLALLSTACSLVLGTLASLALVRGVLPGRRLLNIFFISPMMTPLIVTACAVYGIFAKLHLIGTTVGMTMAHTIICVPYVVMVVSANLYRFDLSLELAARSLGATAFKTFMQITLPIIRPGIIAAGIFCFIESLDELVLALFLLGVFKMTLPLRMFNQIQFRINPVVAAASSVFIVATIGTIIALSFIEKKK